ncbi:MAG: DUF3488 and transglutaminase-like domain-containing protein [Thiolinea sp.]
MNRQVTYAGMIWLLAAQLAVMLPFAFELPFWLLAVVFFSVGWRLRVLSGGVAQPGHLAKAILVGVGVAGLLLSGLRFPSLEAMSALLLLGFAFKSVEVVERRDALVVVFIGSFLVALQFLYSQSMLSGLYGVLALLILTGALIGVQQAIPELSALQQVRFNLRLGGILLLQCLPLMIVIFIFTPRLQPFWSLPLLVDQAKSGISDRMAPGDIAKLTQSGQLAFRVTFKGQRPPQGELYWQGLVLNHFDGREWRQFADEHSLRQLKAVMQHNYRFQPNKLLVGGDPLEYEAIYEPTGQPWLFALNPSVTRQDNVLLAADYRLMASQELQSPFLLRASSYAHSARDIQLDPYVRQLALQLPHGTDPRSHALASSLRSTAASDADYIRLLLQRFREQPFQYTLQPPLMGDNNTIDAFLFDAQSGFCAHYAGSLVFMLRAVGIPARVVVGYQGGEWNESGQYLSVHQFDAHAWTEAWLPDKGWLRIDPTSMVAPERTEQGSQALAQQEGSFLSGQLFSVRRIAWLNQLRLQLDSLQYGWQRWVLSYDGDTQMELFKSLLGEVSISKMASLAAGLLAAILLFWLLALGLTRRRVAEAREHRLYRQFCERLAQLGVTRATSQTPGDFAEQAARALPAQADRIRQFTRLYEAICYLPEQQEQQRRIYSRCSGCWPG